MTIDLKNKPKDYNVLFLDMNAYFASVEQQVQPPLRGQPVGIAPYTGATGCIIARSYEAKEWGIGVGDLVRDARVKCPKIHIVEARPALYQLYHKEILKVLERHSPNALPLSIDEFLLRLTGSDVNKDRSLKMACDIKNDLKNVGDYLTCSVGIGPNYFLAKVAGESKKPDGLTLIKLNELDNFYSQLNLRDLPGINFRMEFQLAKRGIYRVSDFFKLDLVTISKMFGHMGKAWFYRLRGYEIDSFEIKNKSCGHSHVLPPELRSEQGARATIRKLVEKAGYRLRKQKLWATGIYVSIHFLEGGGFNLAKRTNLFNDNSTFQKEIDFMLKKCRWHKPLYVAVNAFGLVQNKNQQISIFPEIERSRNISKALDRINDTYGANTIFPASVFSAKFSAPDRIPFGIPRYDIRNF
jgi:DNA polymerase-4